MLQKILIISGVVITIIAIVIGVIALKKDKTGGASLFLNRTFISALSSQVVGGLPTIGGTAPAEVTQKDLGEISPFARKVFIVKDSLSSVKNTSLESEYIEIRANKNNTLPIDISNWSLQSMVSGVWIGIPQGVNSFEAGTVNKLSDIYLKPGDTAFISSGESPVGYSFRVNNCSGFLSATQDFVPYLSSSCVNPAQLLPPTIKNIKTFGDSCISFAAKFNSCTYLIPSTPGFQSLSASCREYLQPRLTYNYCKTQKENDSSFYDAQEWRVFLNQKKTLWKNQYEVIRLLDDKNRTVDVINY